jgi:hypothetical protein
MSKAALLTVPDSVPIGSQIYTIRQTTFPDAGESELCEYDAMTKIVWLRHEYANVPAFLLAFAHGLLHGVEEEYGVDFKDNDIDRIAQGVVQMIIALVEAQE